jgi:dTDP-4-dehydrorhamnose reductase
MMAAAVMGAKGQVLLHLSAECVFAVALDRPFGVNFIPTMLRLDEAREEVGVLDDRRGNPTLALDIADALARAACCAVDPTMREANDA